MSFSEIVEQYISLVEGNQHVEAVEKYYADNIVIRDNQANETRGKTKQLENEKNLLLKVRKMNSECVRPIFLNGDYVVIKWRFRFEFKNDTYIEIEEIAYQQWENGQIIKEQFFFDPKQLERKPINSSMG